MHTNVKSTSIATYHKTAPKRRTQREIVARYILKCTKEGRRTWRRDIARALQMEVSSVAGRVNEIDFHGIELDGLKYRLEFLENKEKDPLTGVSCETFSLVIDNLPKQGKLFANE